MNRLVGIRACAAPTALRLFAGNTQPLRVCVTTRVSAVFLGLGDGWPIADGSLFVPGAGTARVRLLRFSAQVSVADQVVCDRRQRPFDRGCRFSSAVALPPPSLLLSIPRH